MSTTEFESDRTRFIKAHGGENQARQYYVKDANENEIPAPYLLFPDGARVHFDSRCESIEPPQDRIALLKLISRYREIRVAEAKQAFSDFRNMMQAHFDSDNFRGVYCGPQYTGSEAEAFQELKQRRDTVWHWEYELEKVQKELEQLASPKKTQEARYERDEERSREKFYRKLRRLVP